MHLTTTTNLKKGPQVDCLHDVRMGSYFNPLRNRKFKQTNKQNRWIISPNSLKTYPTNQGENSWLHFKISLNYKQFKKPCNVTFVTHQHSF